MVSKVCSVQLQSTLVRKNDKLHANIHALQSAQTFKVIIQASVIQYVSYYLKSYFNFTLLYT